MTVTQESGFLDDYLRVERLPHIWCSGCGLGIVLNCYARALLEAGVNLDKVVTISGIGCTGRASGYVNTDGFHTTHGRAIPFATGVRIANPDLTPVVISGDGDLLAIGGNHLIHAARRNVDMLVICVNNFNYGMTGAQYGPTTPIGVRTPTSPRGVSEPPFNVVALVASAGAAFVSRWTVYHAPLLKESIKKGLDREGFRFIEVISPCPTGFGRLTGLDGLGFMRMLRDVSKRRQVHPTEARIAPGEEIVVGNFVDGGRARDG